MFLKTEVRLGGREEKEEMEGHVYGYGKTHAILY